MVSVLLTVVVLECNTGPGKWWPLKKSLLNKGMKKLCLVTAVNHSGLSACISVLLWTHPQAYLEKVGVQEVSLLRDLRKHWQGSGEMKQRREGNQPRVSK